ncbi:major paralogous domain-containing protein [Fibrobacter sp. UWCM]|uniref:FISUMP domain-containing protein n=1 Tax=Fibrobacter sp. UWCM TaxID=1896208 RepID=UPI0009177C23|nr:FISUMP domain-containing protein [Fibrobacter sp. UWCM]SHH93174.1 major paralogous domain-containing protein [Fibrobacter sp. UWCM]
MKKSFQRVIATLNLFQGKQSLTIFLLAAFFALSACDDSSSASSDETSVSSSSVETSDLDESSSSVDKKSSGNESTEKDKSSSSVKGSEPAEVSSSSAKETKNSSDSKSSSSVKSGESSSSKKDVSSSSVSSSSSVKSSSSSVGSSSSSVKQSSSSVVSSSSFVKIDYTNPSHTYGELEDPRDHRKYKYLTVKGTNKDGERGSVTVMAENLNVGIMVQGAEDQTDFSKIEKYCYNNDSLNCIQYGGLYQWAEAMQLPSECNTKSCAAQIDPDGDGFHQGICPKGWHLLTYDEFYIVVHADENVNPLVEGVRAIAFGGHNYSGYSLIGGGMRITPSGNFKEKNEVAYWFYPGENEYENYSCGDDGYMGNTSKSLNTNVSYKQNGLSIRCVKDE